MQRRVFLGALAAALAIQSPLAYSNDWPTKSIKIIVPFPPGGSTDILGRAVAEYLQKSLGVPVVVENMPGATGTIGTAAVARAAPDGYTLMMGSIGTMITNHFVFDQLSYGIQSLDPIINIAETPNVVLVNPKLNINTLAELIAYMKANPGKLNHGSPGVASSSHVSAEVFKRRVGVEAEHVPYKGSTPMLVDLMGGRLDFTIDNISSSLELIKGNKLKAIAVTSRNRSPLLPDVPTVIEAGLPGYVMAPWFCVAAPAGTPQPIIQKLNSVLNNMLKDERVRALLLSYGAEPVGGSSQDLAKLMRQEAETYSQLAKQVNFKPKS